jgi:hypothetical protein
MRAFILGLSLLAACTGDDDGTSDGGGNNGSDVSAPAWNDGPSGHVFTYSTPLYDVDAHTGSVLRQPTVRGSSGLVAGNGSVYFRHPADTESGDATEWQLPPATLDAIPFAAKSLDPYGVVGNELIGQDNAGAITRTDLTTGVITTVPFPQDPLAPAACENGSIYEHTVYMTCQHISAGGTKAAMLSYDLDANTFGPVVDVIDGESLSAASNVTATPAGVVFVLYTPTPPNGATLGTRTAYKIMGTWVSAPVAIPGNSDDLDEQAAAGNTIYMTMGPDQTIVPFDVATMTAGTPIAADHPHHLIGGGGQIWFGAHGHDGQLGKLNPASNTIEYKAFPLLVSTEIDSLAYSD